MDQGGSAWAVSTGMAEVLPADFDDAVARTIEVVHSLGGTTPTAR